MPRRKNVDLNRSGIGIPDGNIADEFPTPNEHVGSAPERSRARKGHEVRSRALLRPSEQNMRLFVSGLGPGGRRHLRWKYLSELLGGVSEHEPNALGPERARVRLCVSGRPPALERVQMQDLRGGLFQPEAAFR